MQPANQQDTTEKPGASVNLRPDIVENIPLKAPSAPLAPISEDHELDKLMHDVSQDIKKTGPGPHKKKFFEFKRRPKAQKTAPQLKPVPPPPQTRNQPKAQPTAAQAKAAPQAKPVKQSSVPVLAIVVAIIMTGILVAAAFKAYK